MLGDPAGGTDVGHQLALAAATPMLGRFGAFGELAGLVIPGQRSDIFASLGVTYNPDRAHVFDLGFVVGLNDDAPDLMLVFGLTTNLGYLGRARKTAATLDQGP
ncbi:MAG: hypothetical protein O2816_04315 [Planctomycetota bacterium]|nr:hypothetical protein [Planctomycetota bacterium]